MALAGLFGYSLARLLSEHQLTVHLPGSSGENPLPGSLRSLGVCALITPVFYRRKLKPREVLYLHCDYTAGTGVIPA